MSTVPAELHARQWGKRRLPHVRAVRRDAALWHHYLMAFPAARRTSTRRGETAPAAGASGGIKTKTTEDDVVRLAALRPARATTIEVLARTRWLTRRRVRMTILLNPGSPPRVALPLVGLCTRTELLEVARGADVPVILRITANELAERRPPLFGENASERGSEPPSGPERLLQ